MSKILETYLQKHIDLPKTDLDYICSHFRPIQTKRNEIIVNYNMVCDSYYFITKGTARIFTINKEGLETTRYFAFQNSFCTALPSFINQNPSQEYFQTLEKSELLKISRSDFYNLMHIYSEFESIYREILENAFIISQQRIYGFQGFNALEKVQWIIKNQPEILLKISNKMAASYLGMSPSTLSRVKSKL